MITNGHQPPDRDRAIDSEVDPGVDPAVELDQQFKSENPNESELPKSEDRTSDLGNRQIITAHEQGGAMDAGFS